RSTLRLSHRSAAAVSTRTLALRTIAALASSSRSALRATRITVQPSPASTSAAARPIPFDPPGVSAVIPASRRSVKGLPTFSEDHYRLPASVWATGQPVARMKRAARNAGIPDCGAARLHPGYGVSSSALRHARLVEQEALAGGLWLEPQEIEPCAFEVVRR